MSIVIIYGEPATGKTRHAIALKNYYGCKTITDGWDGSSFLRDETLALTNKQPPFNIKSAAGIHISVALAHMNNKKATA